MSRSGSTVVLSTGHAYPEGPCFSPDGRLFVVELAGGAVARVENGRRHVEASTPGSPNGAAFADDGVLYICNNGGNWGPNDSTGGASGLGGGVPRLQALHPDGSLIDILTEVDGRALNGPNDVVLDAHGGLWFTDPAWADRDAQGAAPAAASPPGAVVHVGPGGEATRVADGLVFPNGLALTPEQDALLVGETGTGRILCYPILTAGSLGEPSVFAELGPTALPDGMCHDADGTLIVAGTGSGRLFVVSETGDLLEEIATADPDVTNVCFGGADGRTLIITEASLGRVSAMQWEVPGLPLPGSPTPWT